LDSFRDDLVEQHRVAEPRTPHAILIAATLEWMIHSPRSAGLLLSIAAAALVTACSSSGGGAPDSGSAASSDNHKRDRDRPSAAPIPTVTAPTGPTSVELTRCPTPTATVHDAKELSAALSEAAPGAVIELAPATYEGRFTATRPGTAAKPIFLCGSTAAILDGGSVTGGYGLHLDHVSYWRLVGFTVRDAQKGVVADATTHTVIDSLTVRDIGDEAIHLRATSTDNVVARNTISHTGQRRDKFGEGVYVGTAQSNWCKYSACKPDPSNHNAVIGNHISDTTAESVDIKEGTSLGVVAGNTFDGASLSGADSWVDAKGNGWLIYGNTGSHSPQDGFQTHQIVDGAGVDNVFARNVAKVDGPGYGFHLTPTGTNVVRCDNREIDAKQGLANIDCTK
jgi:hypothetical protein